MSEPTPEHRAYLPGSSIPVPRASCVAPTVCPVVRYAQRWDELGPQTQRRDWQRAGALHMIEQRLDALAAEVRRLVAEIDAQDRPGP